MICFPRVGLYIENYLVKVFRGLTHFLSTSLYRYWVHECFFCLRNSCLAVCYSVTAGEINWNSSIALIALYVRINHDCYYSLNGAIISKDTKYLASKRACVIILHCVRFALTYALFIYSIYLSSLMQAFRW